MTGTRSLQYYCQQAAGELTFCKVFGIPFEPDSSGRFAVVLDGVSVEIEPAEDTAKPVLRFDRRNDFRKDVIVVTSLSGRTCALIGWIDRDRFRSLFRASAGLGLGVRPLVLDRSALRPMEELRAFIKEKRRAA
jgi:hypothetical protein